MDDEQITRKSKLQKTSKNLSRLLFEPLQAKPPLVQMQLSRGSLEKPRLTLSKTPKKQRSPKISFPKPDSPTKIINLPKLPFGKHSSYNYPNFVKTHFLKKENEASESQISELRHLDKQQKLKRKLSFTRQTSPMSPRSPRKVSFSPKVKEFSGSGGKIVIQNYEAGCESYVLQKLKYSFGNFERSPAVSPRGSASKMLPFFIL